MEETSENTKSNSTLEQAIAARRTFAIISHPDAQNNAHRKAPFVRQCHRAGRERARQKEPTQYHVRLDGNGTQSAVFPYRPPCCNFPIKITSSICLIRPGIRIFLKIPIEHLPQWIVLSWCWMPPKALNDRHANSFDVCRKRGIPIFTFIEPTGSSYAVTA